ncbi:hypothetical protein GGQ69_000834 [Micrococcus sp. TA1]|nr:hypothetical protein [Micrococcus sp. TA1]
MVKLIPLFSTLEIVDLLRQIPVLTDQGSQRRTSSVRVINTTGSHTPHSNKLLQVTASVSRLLNRKDRGSGPIIINKHFLNSHETTFLNPIPDEKTA